VFGLWRAALQVDGQLCSIDPHDRRHVSYLLETSGAVVLARATVAEERAAVVGSGGGGSVRATTEHGDNLGWLGVVGLGRKSRKVRNCVETIRERTSPLYPG